MSEIFWIACVLATGFVFGMANLGDGIGDGLHKLGEQRVREACVYKTGSPDCSGMLKEPCPPANTDAGAPADAGVRKAL